MTEGVIEADQIEVLTLRESKRRKFNRSTKRLVYSYKILGKVRSFASSSIEESGTK